MPTPIDRALNSKSAFLGFAGIVTAVAAWSIWGGDMFPTTAEDRKDDPARWSDEELRAWLSKRNLLPAGNVKREDLLSDVRAGLGKKK